MPLIAGGPGISNPSFDDLNVNIRVPLEPLRKDLRNAEKMVGGFGGKFGALARKLTPYAAGFAAVGVLGRGMGAISDQTTRQTSSSVDAITGRSGRGFGGGFQDLSEIAAGFIPGGNSIVNFRGKGTISRTDEINEASRGRFLAANIERDFNPRTKAAKIRAEVMRVAGIKREQARTQAANLESGLSRLAFGDQTEEAASIRRQANLTYAAEQKAADQAFTVQQRRQIFRPRVAQTAVGAFAIAPAVTDTVQNVNIKGGGVGSSP